MRVFGFHPIREALRRRPHEVECVLVATGRSGRRLAEIEELCGRHRVPIRRVPPAELGAGAEVHNGFAAVLRAEAESKIVAGGARAADRDLVVLAEDVQDPRNLGALLRVCEAAGVGRVLIRDRGSAPLSATTIKASAGATEWLSIERVTNAAGTIEALQRDGFWVYGLAPEGEAPWALDLSGKVAFCVGGEGSGLRTLTRERCDRLIGLPMRGRLESLNVATAAAAVLYEAVRQRSGGGKR